MRVRETSSSFDRPALKRAFDQFLGFAAGGQRVAQDRQLGVQAAQLPVGCRHLARQHQQHAVAVVLGRQRLGVGRFDDAAHAAPQVELIREAAPTE
jgi:hypothetical protein